MWLEVAALDYVTEFPRQCQSTNESDINVMGQNCLMFISFLFPAETMYGVLWLCELFLMADAGIYEVILLCL